MCVWRERGMVNEWVGRVYRDRGEERRLLCVPRRGALVLGGATPPFLRESIVGVGGVGCVGVCMPVCVVRCVGDGVESR